MNKLALLAALPFVVGCGTPPPTSLSRLSGTTWQFNAIDGAAPVGKETSLRFDKGRIGANVGCNGMGADAKLIGGRIVAGPVISTQMYCEGVMEQERAVGALLGAKPTMTVRETSMTLRGGGHSARLSRKD
ncbi:META domain-containing protein [Novosphingobium aquae]|uniref:META domain-containing protein n=1 Tax=Novosphingobium aquae TaxID=3133435 RepID=A0ABU8S3R6_9SPHN